LKKSFVFAVKKLSRK